jgi:hypothetical protein
VDPTRVADTFSFLPSFFAVSLGAVSVGTVGVAGRPRPAFDCTLKANGMPHMDGLAKEMLFLLINLLSNFHISRS